MKNTLLHFIILFAFFNIQVNAQDSLSINNYRFSLKASCALVNSISVTDGTQPTFVQQKPQFAISMGYNFLKNFNTGLSIAHVNGSKAIPDTYSEYVTNYMMTNSSIWYYGLGLSYDILPAIFKTNRIRFDVYPILHINYVRDNWININSNTPGSTNFWEFNGGVGLGYNFNKHFGIFTESLMGRFYNYDKFQLKVGFKCKF